MNRQPHLTHLIAPDALPALILLVEVAAAHDEGVQLGARELAEDGLGLPRLLLPTSSPLKLLRLQHREILTVSRLLFFVHYFIKKIQ